MDMSSANIYVNKLKNKYDIIEDGTMKISICSEFVKYYSMMNMCDTVIYYHNEMALTSQKIYEQYMYQNIYEIQQKYDNELQRNVYQKKLNKRLYIILCILTVLFLVSMISFIIITNSKRREKDLSKRVDNLNSEKKDYDKFKYEIKESLNNSLKERIKIIKEVNDFEHNNRTNKNVKEIKQYAYGSPFKTAFEASEDVIESSYGDITSFIKKTFPELNETEYKVCLLSVVPISVDDIANIIELGVDSVGKARTNIRKKMKIENKRASFSEYILEKYYQRED
jgi:DNA-binding CsgD family transcriptional regulator